ncbi:MAG: hypothetical protein M1826_005580 [Phylliscum demangeonii]|nr:MAG: hypothetical protein M1826_005580 [Phylliscum demangeonii]
MPDAAAAAAAADDNTSIDNHHDIAQVVTSTSTSKKEDRPLPIQRATDQAGKDDDAHGVPFESSDRSKWLGRLKTNIRRPIQRRVARGTLDRAERRAENRNAWWADWWRAGWDAVWRGKMDEGDGLEEWQKAKERTTTKTTETSHEGGPDDGGTTAALGPFGNALFLSSTLSTLHLTLDVLVHQQYRQTIEWRMISFLLFTLVYLVRRHTRYRRLQPLFFFACSVLAGCWLIDATNVAPYFAVMKRAPPLGTLWVWAVLEMDLMPALASLVVAVAFFWWGGYSL